MRIALSFALVGLGLANSATNVTAADESKRPAAAAPSNPNTDEKDEPPDRYLAITGGTVHTVTGPTLDGATVLCKNGKIMAVGMDVVVPAGAPTIQARGHHVYPGLIAAGNTVSLVGSGDPSASTDVYGLPMTLALAGGLTTVVAGNTAVKLTWGTVEDMVLKRDLFVSLNYSTRNPAGRRKLREALERVRGHLRDLEEYARKRTEDPKAPKPDERWIRGDYQTALRLIKGEAVAFVSADTAQDILEIANLARQYGFELVLQGAREAWAVASDIAQAKVSAIVAPRTRSDPDERTNRPTGATIQNPRVLHDHGVPIAITTVRGYISTGGMAGRDLQHLPLEAAYAVRGGLSDEAAVRAITIDAARILRVDHRVGSIETGKDADFTITDGDLLHYLTHVRWTVVNGRVAYDKMKESLFNHIEAGRDAPPPDDYWPRSLGEGL